MEEETDLGCLDEESRLVLLTGREYTQPGSVVSNCILLIGSPEGDCGKCTKPCLHPLATDDLKTFFQNAGVQSIDWLDDTACILICDNPTSVKELLVTYFDKIFSEESGLEWYRSKSKVEKLRESDSYGEKGNSIHIYCRMCLSSDIETLKNLRKAKMVNNIIKRRKELQNAKKKVKAKKNKRKQQRKKKKLAKEQEDASGVKKGDSET